MSFNSVTFEELAFTETRITNDYLIRYAVALAQSANVELIDRDKFHSLIKIFY